MEREHEANETAPESTAYDLDSAGKQADEFDDEIKQPAAQADDSTSSTVVKGIGAAPGPATAADSGGKTGCSSTSRRSDKTNDGKRGRRASLF